MTISHATTSFLITLLLYPFFVPIRVCSSEFASPPPVCLHNNIREHHFTRVSSPTVAANSTALALCWIQSVRSNVRTNIHKHEIWAVISPNQSPRKPILRVKVARTATGRPMK